MAGTAKRTDPKLWDAVKAEVTAGDKGGEPGQWSARKAQMAVQQYKTKGGGYAGRKSPDNHLVQWTEEKWGTQSGRESLESGERYLPKAARDALSKADYARTSAKKRKDLKAGRQFSAQPKDVAEKTAPFREHGGGEEPEASKAELYAKAKVKGVAGRSKMSKAELARAVEG